MREREIETPDRFSALRTYSMPRGRPKQLLNTYRSTSLAKIIAYKLSHPAGSQAVSDGSTVQIQRMIQAEQRQCEAVLRPECRSTGALLHRLVPRELSIRAMSSKNAPE